jgi:hypothetical protein
MTDKIRIRGFRRKLGARATLADGYIRSTLMGGTAGNTPNVVAWAFALADEVLAINDPEAEHWETFQAQQEAERLEAQRREDEIKRAGDAKKGKK